MMKLRKSTRGFTLIELLVVIAIIGILSSVVLASLNSARAKGANAAIKSNLANLRAGAEIYYDGTGSNKYEGVCDSPQFMTASSSIASAGVAGMVCTDDDNNWSASAPLKVSETAGGFYCVGSSGASKNVGTNLASASSTACN